MNIGDLFFCSKCMRKIEEEGICPYCGHDPDGPISKNALEEGSLLQNGRYQLGAVLGIGGFGITYAAWDHTLAQPVAIKEYFPQSLSERDIREADTVLVTEENRQPYEVGLLRFNREARILSTLQNIKSVVTVHDWFETNGTAYIVMEFVRGKTLEQYVREEQLAPAKLFAMLRDLIDSLVSIHAQGVLHRDISPGNLMVQEDETVKLIDFGAATVEERRMQGKDRTVIFSRTFAPPEQYDENGIQGPWTDVYALSATLYFLITGEPPQDALSRKGQETLKALADKNIRLKKWEEKAILDGMILSPQKRIQSMDIFRSTLYHLPMPEEIRRRRQFMAKVFAAMAGLAAAGILLTVNTVWGFPINGGLRLGVRMDGLHVTGYGGQTETLVIPSNVLGIPVTEIENGALGWKPCLTEVTVPGSVKRIGPRAFSGCEALLAVTIEEGNQTIDEYAFSDCPSLRTLILPESTRRVSSSAFNGDSKALTVWCEDESLPQTQIIALGACNTAALSDYETAENDTGVSVTNYHGSVSQYESADSLVIPDYIGNRPVTAFAPVSESVMFSSKLTSIQLPKQLEYLPAGIVNGITSLEEIRLGTSLKEIGAFAFRETGVKNLELPETLETIGEEAFSQSFIENIRIPDSVTSVGDYTFYCCIRLTSATLSNGIKTIPDAMFHSCTDLTDVTLPDELETIGHFAFTGCSSLKAIKLPVTVKTINSYAFSECENLRIIYIPAGTTSIAVNAFDGCPSSMVIAGVSETTAQSYADKFGFPFQAIDQWNYDAYGISDTGGLLVLDGAKEEENTVLPSVFPGGTGSKCHIIERLVTARSLKSKIVTLPKYVTVVATMAFMENDALTEVYAYKDLQRIGDETFYNCPALRRFHLENGIREIGSLAFAKDSQLTDIIFPDSLEKIGFYAFWKCEDLTEIHIPLSLTILDDGCFSETGITEVTVPGNVAKCRTAFYGCKALKSAVLEEGVRTLWGTFSQCSALETVTLPSTVTEISRSTFHGCSSLKDVWIYSMDANLDFVWSGMSHITEITHGENDEPYTDRIRIEEDAESTPPLFADCPDVTIHGYPGSTAEAYAKEHGIAFEAIE